MPQTYEYSLKDKARKYATRPLLEGATKELAGARPSVAVNSVGLLDLVEIAGGTPRRLPMCGTSPPPCDSILQHAAGLLRRDRGR